MDTQQNHSLAFYEKNYFILNVLVTSGYNCMYFRSQIRGGMADLDF